MELYGLAALTAHLSPMICKKKKTNKLFSTVILKS